LNFPLLKYYAGFFALLPVRFSFFDNLSFIVILTAPAFSGFCRSSSPPDSSKKSLFSGQNACIMFDKSWVYEN
jgi:hypothetical protein